MEISSFIKKASLSVLALAISIQSAWASSPTQEEVKLALQSTSDDPWLTANEFHQYAGLTTLGLIGLLVVSPKEEDGPHEYFAKAAAATAATTAASGFVVHWDDFHIDNGFTDPDNLHALLGTIGAIAMVQAISVAPDGGHQDYGMLGAYAMMTAIKLTW